MGLGTMSRFGSLEFGENPSEPSPGLGPAKDGRYYLNEAASSLENGFLRDALRHYSRVMEFEAGNVEAWVGQIRMLSELAEEREAGVWAAKAVERFPQSADILACRAISLAHLGDTSAALAFSDAAIERSHLSPLVWLARGEVLLARGGEKSEHVFARAIDLEPTLWTVRWHASRAHARRGNHAKALKFAREGLSISPTTPLLWLEKARAELALGLGREARHSLSQTSELSPRMPGLEELLQTATQGGRLASIACRIKSLFQKA